MLEYEISYEQRVKLYELLVYLRENNAYFARYIHSLTLENVISVWSGFPITSKADIKENFNRYISSTNKEFSIEMTSGTLGMPIQCLKTNAERNIKSLSIWKRRRKIDEKVNVGNFLDLLGKFSNGKYNVLDVSEQNIECILHYIKSQKPRWLCATPSLMYIYAKFLEKCNNRIDLSSICYIELQGESMDKKKRQLVEKIFSAKTIMNYGNRECWNIAFEEENDLHINSNILVEIVGENIIITDLVNKLMPIIRYDTGDKGEILLGEDNKTPILLLTESRRAKPIFGHGGKVGDIIFKRVIHRLLREYEKNTEIIISYKVVQIDVNIFDFFVIPGHGYNEEISKKIVEYTLEELSENCSIRVKKVKRIPMGRNAKKCVFEIDSMLLSKGEK